MINKICQKQYLMNQLSIYNYLNNMSRQQYIYLTRIAENADRFSDMAIAINKIAQFQEQLSIDEIHMFSLAYTNIVGSLRATWRCLKQVQRKQLLKGSKNMSILKNYKSKIKEEITRKCNEVIDLIDTKFLQNNNNFNIIISLYKMKCYYCQYISEVTDGEAHENFVNKANETYKIAIQIAQKEFDTTHPIRLGLALNYSVFLYQINDNSQQACKLAKKSIDDALNNIDKIQEGQYKNTTDIMQLIKDNLALWNQEMEEAKK